MTRLYRTRAGTDRAGTLRLRGRYEIEAITDEAGYAGLRYGAGLGGPATATVATTSMLLQVLTTSQYLACPAEPTGGPVAGYDGAVTERAKGTGMAGPQDYLAEQGRVPDQARPYEADNPQDARVRPDDLQSRMDRLPINHPSSPHRDDGSRKPLPPDLTQYELPLPDEADSRAEPELADQPRTAPDGSWHWKSSHLKPDESRAGDEVLAQCRTAEGRDNDGNYGEHGLTPAMRRIEAQLDHGHLVGDTEKFALKDSDRFKEKLADVIARNPDKSCRELANEIHDAIRYTFIFSAEAYSDGMWDTQGKIEAAGYELEVRRNSWRGEEYKGINSRWLDLGSGKRFEVQFHTQESWEAKQQTHHAYERMKDPRTLPDEVKRHREYQKQISQALEIPSGAPDIPDYRKEGR